MISSSRPEAASEKPTDRILDLYDEAAAAQLQRRHVYGDAHGGEPDRAPAPVVLDRFAERPAPHFVDESGLFQDWYKTGGRDEAGLRIIPTDQRLGTRDLTAREVYLGLALDHAASVE